SDRDIWERALRAIEQDGDPTLLAELLWRTEPDDDGMTRLPADAVFGLAELLTRKNAFERVRIVREKISPRDRATAARHEQIVQEMLALIKGGKKTEAAKEIVAKRLGIGKHTVRDAWNDFRDLPVAKVALAVRREGRCKKPKPLKTLA